jgi:DNA-binding CsgD family transcriptional regulator
MLSRAVARTVAHDALMVTGRNPDEGMAVLGMNHRYEDDLFHSVQCLGYQLGTLYRTETLSHQRAVAAVIDPTVRSDAIGEHDVAIRNLFRAHGISSELRMPLQDRHGVWGTLSLLRSAGGRAFGPDDVSRCARFVQGLIAVVREYVTAGPLVPSTPPTAAGVVIVRADHTLRAMTPQIKIMLEQMPRHRRATNRIHEANLIGLATQARGHAHDPVLSPAIALAPAATYGRWLATHAQPLGDGTGDIVITVQPATGRLLLPTFSRWHGLTAREHQILDHLCTGAASKHIARRQRLSTHTVNDHLKAIYRKTRTTGRDELTAALTS